MKAWIESESTQIYNVTEKARGVIDHPPDDACLSVWLVHAPWMHIAWCWHYCSLIHLRDLPNQSKPPTLQFPEATHEFIVFALDPDHRPNLDVEKLEPLHILEPVSIVQQFNALSDAAALGRVEHMLRHVAQGQLTLDSDGRRSWRTMLGMAE
jgi:hypothetical protein